MPIALPNRSKFLTCHKGAAATMFAVLLLPLTAIVGGALDVSRAYVTRTKLQASVDGAVRSEFSSLTGDLPQV